MKYRDQARLFGVLGDPVDHSLSPAMQNAAFAAIGLPHVYLRYRVPQAALARALSEAKALRMGGLNLTVPLKEAVLPLLDALTPAAGRIGAVNTILFAPDGRMRGDNTDGEGFLRALAGRVRVRGTHAVVIGAGGAARAVGTALVDAGCRAITIANRTIARAERLAERLGRLGAATVTVVPLEALAAGDPLVDAGLVVNTTPLARLRIRWAASPARCTFMDLVYARAGTPFLAGAARARRPTLDGSAMLLHQGALAFEAWTGHRAPRAAMARALRAAGLSSLQLREVVSSLQVREAVSLTEPNTAASLRVRRPPKEA